jgi:hypothetical protein
MTEDRRMRDVPMLAVDRERMQAEFDGFDDLTPDEFREAAKRRVDSLLDLANDLLRDEP